MKYDIKTLLTELARTRTYARSIDLPSDLPSEAPSSNHSSRRGKPNGRGLETVADASQTDGRENWR